MLPIPSDTLLQQRYRILNMLREGGFGRTYLATDRAHTNGTERTDADEFCEIQEFIPTTQVAGAVTKAKESFKQQAILLYQLQHSQIPHFWATFEEQERLFLVLDYIEGKTYGQILEERRDAGGVFSETEVRQFLLQIVPALGYIHSKGVIHREISPDNIILRSSDRLPVLSDFGVVKEFADKLQLNSESNHIHSGKPGYAPVEQLTSGELYPSSDLYALAVTAIVLLTGKEASALFTGDRMNWDWRKWTRITDGLADVLQRMLNPQPNERYQAAIEVYQDLQALDRIPDSQPLPTPAPSAPSTNPRSEMPTVAVGATPTPVAPDRVQTAITPLNAKSIWEKPQVFIPFGILISLLAGLGSWFAVTHLLQNKSSEQANTTPPKQIDFDNPTIPTGSSPTSSPTLTTTNAETIQPVLERAVIKEGTVDATTPIRFKIAGTSGQNLDIQLMPISGTSGDPTKSPLPTTGTQSSSSTTSPLPAIPGAVPTQTPKSTTIPTASIAPITATQVLMSVLSSTGTPLDAQADRVVGWRGQIDTPGDYTIELRPIAGLSGKAYPYKLSVTQLAALPSPSPSPTESITPSSGSTPPLSIPVPIGGNGLNPSPSSPNPTSSDSSSPNVSPIIVPSETPKANPSSSTTESQRPTRRRRRARRTETEPSPQVRQRRRVESSNEETPTLRRRRRQVESNTEETPTPRRRRNRVANTETPTRSTPSTAPKSDSTESTTPKPESIEVPSPKPEPIAVPSPRNNSVPSTSPSSGNSNNEN